MLAQLTGQAWWVWAAAAVDGASAVAANVVVAIAVVGGMDRRVVSTASGVVAVAMYLGFASGPLSFGLLVDNFGGYNLGVDRRGNCLRFGRGRGHLLAAIASLSVPAGGTEFADGIARATADLLGSVAHAR